MNVAEKAALALRIVREEKADIAYDTETSGLDWKRNYVVGYVITNKDHSLYIPVRHGGGGNILGGKAYDSAEAQVEITDFEKELAQAFEDRERLGGVTVGHNMKFDLHMSLNHNIRLGRNVGCTAIRAALIDEYARSYSLDSCAERHGVTAKKGEMLYDHIAASVEGSGQGRNTMGHFWRLSGSDPLAVEYAEGDGVSTLELWNDQTLKILEEDQERIDKLERDLITTLVRMERRGIKINVEYFEKYREKLVQANKHSLENDFPPEFNTRSPVKVREYVTAAGHTDWPTTEKGNPSFTEKWLKGFPEGQKIIALRKNQNLINTFITPLLEEHCFKGRVHTNINQLKGDNGGTIARLSCNSPNLQAVPKHDKERARAFREGFEADEGYVLEEGDFSQCEPRLFAHYSQEPALLEGYNADPPRDMHDVVAKLFDVDRGTVAKRMNMGILTGMQQKSFAAHMGWDQAKANDMFNMWFNMFPGIKQFQQNAKARLKNRGWVATVLGRRGRLEDARFAYKGTSKVIQGSNADIMKYKLVEMDKIAEAHGDIVHMLLSVHDSAMLQRPDTEEGAKISAEMFRVMADVQSEPFNLTVPFTVDWGAGKTWAEASLG